MVWDYKKGTIVYYNPAKTSLKELKNLNYEDLSDQKIYKSIAIRQSNNVYNQSLVASMIENNGKEKTEKWLKGFMKFSKVQVETIELKYYQ